MERARHLLRSSIIVIFLLGLGKVTGLEGVERVDLSSRVEQSRASFRVTARNGKDLCPDVYELAKKNNWKLCELKKEHQTLESVFNQLTVAKGGVK